MKISLSLFSVLVLVFLGTASAQQSYSNVVAFGDSLSDTGNLSSATIPFPYPFHNNRISDGPVALDYFTESLGFSAQASLHLVGPPIGYNYAVAGGNIIGSDSEDLSPQIDAHLSRVSGSADSEALYVVIMGGNDIRSIRSITSTSVANAEIALIVDQLITQLSRLTDAGAKYFYISNVANIGKIPETLLRESEDPGVSARVTAYTQSYNSLLASRLDDFSQQTDAIIKLFDQYDALEQILDSASELGFVYTDVGCFVDFDFHPGCLLGTRFDRFVFFDNIHPTNATNQIIAEAMIDKLNELEPSVSESHVPIGAIMLLLGD